MDIRRLNLYLDNEEYTCEDKLSGLVLTKIGIIGTIFLSFSLIRREGEFVKMGEKY